MNGVGDVERCCELLMKRKNWKRNVREGGREEAREKTWSEIHLTGRNRLGEVLPVTVSTTQRYTFPPMHSFSRAAVTNDHKPGGLKQKFILW